MALQRRRRVAKLKNRAKVAVDGERNEMVEPSERVARDEHRSKAICLWEGTQEQQMIKSIGNEVTTEENHEKGKAKNVGGSPKEVLANLGKENWEKEEESGGNGVSQHGMIVTQHNVIPKFEFLQAQETTTHDCHMGPSLGINKEGPMAMSYEPDVG